MMVNTAGVPLLHGLLAKAGISKVRQISSPFNVQHDVHISVEDLDDIMHQVPDTWKPYISPARSPMSEHRSSDTHDDPGSSPSTPIYEQMTSNRPHSADVEDMKLTAHMARASLARGGPGGSYPDSPGWLPHIVSVASPSEGNMQAMFRKQRTASGHSSGVLVGSRGVRLSHASAEVMMPSMVSKRTSVPITSDQEGDTTPLGTAGTELNMPDTPQSASARIVSHGGSDHGSANGWNNEDEDAASRANARAAANAAQDAGEAQDDKPSRMNIRSNRASTKTAAQGGGENERKWIKRKSRVVSTIGFAMTAKRFSKTPVTLHSMKPEDMPENNLMPSKAEMMALANKAAKKAAANNDTLLSLTSTPESQTNSFRMLGSERDLDKPTSRHGDAAAGGSSGKSSKKRRENYGELEEYAEGEYGNVYIAMRRTATSKHPKGEYAAIKIVPKAAKARYRKLRTELKILRRIRSQHIVRFYEYFSIDDSVWIVYEFMSRGSITDLLVGYPEIRMPDVAISYAMHEVLTALAYLHERHIIHCDVRSDNVLIDEKGQVKLADFSSAVYLDLDQTSVQKTSLGAIYWMAPELAKGSGYSSTTDVWAAGALIYEMLEGQPPYIEYPDIKVLELASANGMPELSNPDACDPKLVELMLLCTSIAPADRPPASRLRKHESVMSPDSAQCAQLMLDFVHQVESLECDDEESDLDEM
ncbi:hypothetical protein IW140_003325 [Coemansia sp. RSA 1813]|nr:hypothetical protein IW140_003325 [Coemansia sp. RSA 1813]